MSWTDPKRWQALALVLLLGVLPWLLAPILTPFVISALLGWLGDPLVDRLERSGRSRSHLGGAGVRADHAGAGAGAAGAGADARGNRSMHLIESLPRIAAWFTSAAVPWLEARLRVPIARYVDADYVLGWLQGHWKEAGGVAAFLLGHISKSGLALFALVANVALVPVLTFYFLRDWDVMVAQVRDLLPRPYLPTVSRLAREVRRGARQLPARPVQRDALARRDLRASACGRSASTSGADRLHRRPGQLRALPGCLRRRQRRDPRHAGAARRCRAPAAGAGRVRASARRMEGFVLVPWLVGDRIGLHPVAVIFAIMAGGQLFGFLGVLLALPVAAVVDGAAAPRARALPPQRPVRRGTRAGSGSGGRGSAERSRPEARELPPPPDTSAALDRARALSRAVNAQIPLALRFAPDQRVATLPRAAGAARSCSARWPTARRATGCTSPGPKAAARRTCCWPPARGRAPGSATPATCRWRRWPDACGDALAGQARAALVCLDGAGSDRRPPRRRSGAVPFPQRARAAGARVLYAAAAMPAALLSRCPTCARAWSSARASRWSRSTRPAGAKCCASAPRAAASNSTRRCSTGCSAAWPRPGLAHRAARSPGPRQPRRAAAHHRALPARALGMDRALFRLARSSCERQGDCARAVLVEAARRSGVPTSVQRPGGVRRGSRRAPSHRTAAAPA